MLSFRLGSRLNHFTGVLFAVLTATVTPWCQAQTKPPAAAGAALLKTYCATCHSNRLKTADVTLEGMDLSTFTGKAEVLEKVLRKIKSGQMPPAGMPHPDAATAAAFTQFLESGLDAEAAAHPNPGRPAIHRLNRAEYSNAIRDIFDLDITPGAMLPVDDSGYGFDNNGDVLSLSSVLLDRYLSVARKISRQVIGDMTLKPSEDAFEARRDSGRPNPPVPARLEQVSDDLPFNSAGGVSVRYYFPLDAEYVLRIGQGNPNNPIREAPLEFRLPVKAGLRSVGFTFPRESLKSEIGLPGGRRPAMGQASVDLRLDDVRVKRFAVSGVDDGLPRISNLSISGPFNATGPGDTPSRRKVLTCTPANAGEETPCARKILTAVSRRAYRRSVSESDIKPLLAFYEKARQKGPFEYGIQKAIEALLISPDFLFRVELDPVSKTGPGIHRVNDFELASRLSFFLWSSVPDDTLLDLASKSQLSNAAVLKQQVQRMLDDPKSTALVTNFAGQWLQLRNLATVRPDPVVFADFDESLRWSMEREAELFFESIVRENRGVSELLTARYTFLNERLAKHYGIPRIYGSQFRRVELAGDNRGGLLGEAGLLTVTSPPNRTSVVQRGKWILDNLLGAPPPPPPPGIPALEETANGKHNMSLREALEQHRANPGCAGCHAPMDPLGFALENYDGIGRWRSLDGGKPIDASGKLPDGTKFQGPGGLKQVLTTSRREEFTSTVAERLMTYALGRGVEYYDRPALRKILKDIQPNHDRMDDLIAEIVLSSPFQMRRSAD